MNNPILITGAAGFIGSNLARYFVDRKSEVNIIIKKNTNIWRIKDIISKLNVFYGDLTNKKRITNIIKQIKPKTIFHLATHGAYPDQNCAEKIKKIALDSTIHLVNQCKKYSFSVFINTGSSSEYGFKRKSMRENDVLEPNSYYSVFKCAATLYCQYESLNSNINITTIRPFHIYGPYERQSRLIPTLIQKMLKKKKVKLVSSNITRDLVYIDDAIEFYLEVAKQKKLRGEIFNLGSGKKTSIKKIYNLLSKITNYSKKNKWNSMKKRKWDQTIWYSNNNYVKEKLKWKPKINLKNGLIKTIDWYLQHEKKS